MKTDAWIQTYTGRVFYPLSPRSEDVSIDDIAHSLANQCRFLGHSQSFYSVAQHCCQMCMAAPDEMKAEALLHDAAEAYISDIPRPVKHLLGINDIERQVEYAIAQRFRIRWPWSQELHALDLKMLATERRDLCHPDGPAWESIEGIETFGGMIIPWSSFAAEVMFLRLFRDLVKKGLVRE